MRTNTPVKEDPIYTHEGAKAKRVGDEAQLRRTVMACLLWEDGFYEDGVEVAQRISNLVAKLVKAGKANAVKQMAVEARSKMQLRHTPLYLVSELAHQRVNVADVLAQVIQRADELAEFVAIYWKNGRQPLSASVKRGLASAFKKFNAYDLAKYNRDDAVKLRDVLFLSHAKPGSEEQAEVWRKLVDGKLEAPDTWEVALSAGKDKKETFERLIREGRLGGLALLRNLRNMQQAGVDRQLLRERVKEGAKRALPFRFITAAQYAPDLEDVLEFAMFKSLEGVAKLKGRTTLLVDVSGSMDVGMSGRSEARRVDAAAALAVMARELCEDVKIVTFSNYEVTLPPRRGFGLIEAIKRSQPHQGTYLGKAVKFADKEGGDRLIVITDEQSHDNVPSPKNYGNAYMINVAGYQNGVGYREGWTHVDGWSERVLEYVGEMEKEVR